MLNLTPGPVTVPSSILERYQHNYSSPRLSDDFWACYQKTQTHLQTILQTEHQVPVMCGEGMVVFWAGLKSIIEPGDKMVCLANGLYGHGMADIAEKLGADVTRVTLKDDGSDFDLGAFEQAVMNIQPKIISAAHCDTPTGLLNPIEKIAAIKKRHQVPLFFVDAIASVAGTPVNVDANHIDLCLGSNHKVLSCPPDLSFIAVSDIAWEYIERKNYRLGYDALLPFKDINSSADFPYMPNWPALAALCHACELVLTEGLSHVYERHLACMQFTHEQLQLLGYKLYQQSTELCSPTVTAVHLPSTHNWYKFNQQLTKQGLQIGSGLGGYHNQLFRIGHMGNQADLDLLEQAFAILKMIAI